MLSRLRSWFTAMLVLSALTAAPASAQTGVIAGRVTDQTSGQPIASARVEALTGAGRVVGTTYSSNDGNFRLANLAAGTYAVAITQVIGHRDTRLHNIIVTPGQTTSLNAAMVPAAFELSPLAVTATRGQVEKTTEAPASIAVVPQIAIEERPAVSLTEHLRNVQGVDIVNAGVQSQNVVVRGFNNIFSGSLHTLTDYRIASIPSLRVNFLHFVPQTNDDIQQMEVVLGPAAALYGPNTANGVLHMITKSPFTEQGTTVSFTGGERSLLHATGRTSHLLSETLGFKVSGQFFRADDWEYIDPVEESAREQIADPATRPIFIAGMARNPDGSPLTQQEIEQRLGRVGQREFELQRWSVDGRMDWRPTSDINAIFSAGRMVSGRGIELTGIGAGQVDNWAYNYLQGRFNWQRVFAQAYLNTSDAGGTYLLRTGQPITDKSKMFVSQLQHGWDFADWQSFTYGVDYIRTMPETAGTIHGSREDDDTVNEWGAYIQSTTRLSPRFDLVLAGRVDDHSHLPDMVFSPRAAVVFKPAEDHSFRFTFNRAFSTPSSLNLFLDIDAGWPNPALGAMGYRLRAFGPGTEGIRWTDPAGQLYGMRSPAAGRTSLPGVNCPGTAPGQTMAVQGGAGLYCLQINNFLTAAGAAVPAQLAAYLRSLQADPQLPQGLVGLNAYTGEFFDPSQAQNVPGTRESISQTFEVGYKGVIQDRLMLAADVWFDRKENFTSPLILQSPLLLMNPQQLAPFLIQRMMAIGIPQAQAQAIATQAASAPGAVLSSPDLPPTSADLIATYRNFGQVDLYGVDLGATVILTDVLQLAVTASFVSDDHFILPLDGINQVVALNAPKRKGTAALTYRDLVSGLNGELRVRHNAKYPVNSAGYVGMSDCVDFEFGVGIRNERCVQSFNLVDVGVGYRLPMVRGASLQLYVQNVLDDDFRAFVGTPTLGRMALLRLKYDF
jgi:outer membrane receptor for ferrienterochelin and colicins